MTLRGKLLLAQVPLALALLVVGIVSIATVDTLGETSSRILHENYRSVLAAQRMKESAERMDSAALYMVIGSTAEAERLVDAHRRMFESELREQELNVTEPGEAELTLEVRASWMAYQAAYRAFVADPGAEQYFESLQPRFESVKSTAERTLTLNQDAMMRKSGAARQTASDAEDLALGVTVAALVFGLLCSVALTSRVLRPLDNLSVVARRLGDGDLTVRAAVIGKDEIAAVAGEFNDMAARLETFRKSSLGELLQAQLASQAAIDSIPDPVIVFDVTGAVLDSNQAGDALLQLDARARRTDPIAAVEPALRAAITLARDHVLAGRGAFVPRGFEDAVAIASADGPRWLLPRATPLYQEGEGVTGVTVIVQDVTRLFRFDQLRNDLVATVAHEFRTPLTSLRMAIHLCVEGAAGELTDKQLDLLSAAREDCERLQSIVDDLLDMARLRGGQVALDPERVAPEAIVERAFEAHRQEAGTRGIALRTRVTPSLDDILVDTRRLALALDNLVANALRHTPSGGTVTIAADAGDGVVRFSVADTGPGIADEHVPHVFERFYRVPGDAGVGAGIGLSIVRDVVDAHGGAVHVDGGGEDEHGTRRGATFSFTIPLADAGRSPPAEPTDAP